VAIIASTRRGASRSRSGISCVSGIVAQYRAGISLRIALSLMRAGLKMFA
jgi:hypothetical protein